MNSLMVARRFCGPTDSANGGYICGLLAQHAQYGVTVRLLAPPPLETELCVREREDGLELLHEDRVIARARPGQLGHLPTPPAPAFDAAVEAARHYAGFSQTHPAPQCFVCGPRRPDDDGLSIFPGPCQPEGMVAAPWTPDPSLDNGAGEARPEFLWCALDCPGYHAISLALRPMLLGEMTAKLSRPVGIGERCVVAGWCIGGQGRKHEVGTALWGSDGTLRGSARAIWIEPRQEREP